MKDKIGVSGKLTIDSYKGNELVRTMQINNIVVDNGLKLLAGYLIGNNEGVEISKLQLGTGERTKSSSITSLQTPNATKIDFTSKTQSTSFPFYIEKSVVINTQITRPYTASEFGVFYTIGSTDTLFSYVLPDDDVVFSTGETDLVKYGVYIS